MKRAILVLLTAAVLASCSTVKNERVSDLTGESMRKVNFKSEGVDLTGNLYYPENYEQGKAYPAVVVTGAWTTVKEQMPMTYAERLAKEGFITFIFDFRGWGESDGDNRYLEDPIRKTADIVAAAGYIKSLPEVDGERVGGLGVCASSGYMVKAYAEGAFRTVALVAPWLHNREIAAQVYGGEESAAGLIALGDSAEEQFKTTGELQLITAASTSDEASLMYNAPYYTEEDRGLIPAYDNKFNVASWRPWLTFDAIQYADKIPGKVLFVESEAMALPQGSAAFKAVAGDLVESHNLPGVSQFDFYDRAVPVSEAVSAVVDFMNREL